MRGFEMTHVFAPLALAPQGSLESAMESGSFWTLILVLFAFLAIFTIVMLVVRRYKRCPSNRILVVYGRTSKGMSSKTLHGGGTFVWPVIQSYDYLTLDPLQIDVPLKGALSQENIRVNVPSFFTVAVGTDPETMQNAAVRLLGLSQAEIEKQALDIIFGQLRQVIASMTIESINRDRDIFLQSIQQNLEPELEKIGLVLINVNITDITDESGYIEAIGKKAASEAIQSAEIDVAEQEKRGSIGVANAERDRAVEVAQAVKVKEIGTKEAERDMTVQIAEFDKQRTIGERQAEYEREAEVKEAERQMRIQVAKANATAVSGENDSKAVIAGSEAELKVRQAEAYALGETRQRQAEAEVLAAQYKAETEAASANALKVEAQQRAQLEAPARAQKARVEVEAQATAEKMKFEAAGRAEARVIEAEAEAKAIFAKLEAQARGEYEILAKKGEGLREIVQGCGDGEQAFKLLMLEHIDHLADASASAISNIKFDKVTVWDSGNAEGKGGASGFLRGLGQAMPPLMDVMQSIGGVELPEYLGKLVNGDGDGDGDVLQPVKPRAAVTEASGDAESVAVAEDGAAPAGAGEAGDDQPRA